ELVGTVTIDKIRQFFDHPGFVDSYVDSIVESLLGFLADGIGTAALRVLFATHSIPVEDAQRSGPRDRDFGPGGAYAAQHLAVAAAVMERVASRDSRLGAIEWELVYQSRSG